VPAPTTVLTVIKRFTYRGDANEEYSNTYALTGSTPTDSTAWRTLFDALVTQEKTLYKNDVFVIGGYGYDHLELDADGDSWRTPTAIWAVDLTVAPNAPVAGTGVYGSTYALSGDTSNWIRWGLNRMNTKGKRVYLRKYFHPGYADATQPHLDNSSPGWVTAADAFGTKLTDGSFASGRLITDHLGTSIVGHAVGPYVTTRTLKRRGKRPSH
jgi:hypothetical protein